MLEISGEQPVVPLVDGLGVEHAEVVPSDFRAPRARAGHGMPALENQRDDCVGLRVLESVVFAVAPSPVFMRIPTVLPNPRDYLRRRGHERMNTVHLLEAHVHLHDLAGTSQQLALNVRLRDFFLDVPGLDQPVL